MGKTEGKKERRREETMWCHRTRWRGVAGAGGSGENEPGKTREVRSLEVHSVHSTPLTHSHRGLGVPGSDGSGQNQQLPEDVGQGISRGLQNYTDQEYIHPLWPGKGLP